MSMLQDHCPEEYGAGILASDEYGLRPLEGCRKIDARSEYCKMC